MYRKILVGYDGSDASTKAFETARQIALRDGAQLWVLAVARPPEFADEVEAEAVIENSRRHYQSLLDRLRAKGKEAKPDIHFEVVVGHPAQQIIYEADRRGVDLIVVGDKGRSQLAKAVLGSVSRHVVQYADRPVLVVR